MDLVLCDFWKVQKVSYRSPLIKEGQLSVTGKSMGTEYLSAAGGLSLPKNSVVRLSDSPSMAIVFLPWT